MGNLRICTNRLTRRQEYLALSKGMIDIDSSHDEEN
jgi:hypothetical protein